MSVVASIEDELKRIGAAAETLAAKALHEIGGNDLPILMGLFRDLVNLMRHGEPLDPPAVPTEPVIPNVVIPAGNLPKV